MAARVEVIRRGDGKYDWRQWSSNENIVSTSGGQGYSNLIEAVRMAKQENEGLPVYVVEVEAKEPAPEDAA